MVKAYTTGKLIFVMLALSLSACNTSVEFAGGESYKVPFHDSVHLSTSDSVSRSREELKATSDSLGGEEQRMILSEDVISVEITDTILFE